LNAIWTDSRSTPEETVLLSVLNGDEAVYVAVRNSIRPLGLAFRVGLKFPASVSASGKAMLAHLPEEEARLIASKGLKRSTVLAMLWPSRPFYRSWNLPVSVATSSVVAGVSVCVSTASLEGDGAARHRNLALDVARELTERLGGLAVGGAQTSTALA